LNADGSGFFEDCTEETGMNENNNRFSFAPAWCDYNNDGWPDLYVANDFGRKNLYRNEHGRFHDVAASAGVEDLGPGMSASWFDYDHDGKPDLYVANMWSDAGQRLVRDKNFSPAVGTVQQEAYRRHTKGNSLYRNRGDGTFEETTTEQHVEFGRWAWASGGHDLNNDGEAEIFVTCGMFTNSSSTDLMGFFWRDVVSHSPVKAMPSAAYENGWNALNQFAREEYSWNGREPNILHVRRGERYYDFSGVSGLDYPEDSRAFAIVDFDGDGRPDVVLKSRLGPQVRVLQNACVGSNHSIAFRLRGSKSNRDGIGARIQVDGQTKWLDAGSGYLSQHSKRSIFGLGSVDSAKRVMVLWPSGTVQEFSNLAAGYDYTIVEDSSELKSESFHPHRPLSSRPVAADNQSRLHDSWFIEPLPLPAPQSGPGLLILTKGETVHAPAGVPAKFVDLTKEPADLRRHYEIFRRYLFDWRTGLQTPLAFLLNKDGHVVKVYAKMPSTAQCQGDLAKLLAISTRDALPFDGIAVRPLRRDYYKWGAAFLLSGYPNQALPYLDKVLQQTPENPRVLLLVGQIHLQAGRIDAAEKYILETLRWNPNYPEALSELGGVFEARNDFRKAIGQYEKALVLKPDLLYALLNGAQVADKLEDRSKAESWYRHALQIDPQSAEAANGLGLVLAKQDRSDEARQAFEQAIALRRNYSNAINNLGVLYLHEGKVQDAIAAFEYGIRQAPDEDILYLNLGRTYTQLGQLERARAVMQQLLDRKPDNATARRAIQELDRR
jgi:tetratricopeptide (TPR) repeat protein